MRFFFSFSHVDASPRIIVRSNPVAYANTTTYGTVLECICKCYLRVGFNCNWQKLNVFIKKKITFFVITEGSETNTWIWCIQHPLPSSTLLVWRLNFELWAIHLSHALPPFTHIHPTNISLSYFSHCHTKIHHCHLIIHYNSLNPLTSPVIRFQSQFTRFTTSYISSLQGLTFRTYPSKFINHLPLI